MDNTKTAVDWKSLLGAGLAAGAAGALPFIGSIRRGEGLRGPQLAGGQLVDDPSVLPDLVQPGDVIFHGVAGGGSPLSYGAHVDMATSKRKGIYAPGVVKNLKFPGLDLEAGLDTVILRPKLDPDQAKALRSDLRNYAANVPKFREYAREALMARRPDLSPEDAAAIAQNMSWGLLHTDIKGGALHEMFGGGYTPERQQQHTEHFVPRFEMMRDPEAIAKQMVDSMDLTSGETIDKSLAELAKTCAAGRCSTSPAMLLDRHGQGLGINKALGDITPHDYLNSPNFEPVAYYLHQPETRGALLGTPIQRLKAALSLGIGGAAGLAAYGIGRRLQRKPAPLPWNVRLKQHLMAGEFGPAYGAAKEGMGAALRRLGLHR